MMKNILLYLSLITVIPFVYASENIDSQAGVRSSYSKLFSIYPEMGDLYIEKKGEYPERFTDFLKALDYDEENASGKQLKMFIPGQDGHENVTVSCYLDTFNELYCDVGFSNGISPAVSRMISQQLDGIGHVVSNEGFWSLFFNLSKDYDKLFDIINILQITKVISKKNLNTFERYFSRQIEIPSKEAMDRFIAAHKYDLPDSLGFQENLQASAQGFCEQYSKPALTLALVLYHMREHYSSIPNAKAMMKALIPMIPGNQMNSQVIPDSFKEANFVEMENIYICIRDILKDFYSAEDFSGNDGLKLEKFFQQVGTGLDDQDLLKIARNWSSKDLSRDLVSLSIPYEETFVDALSKDVKNTIDVEIFIKKINDDPSIGHGEKLKIIKYLKELPWDKRSEKKLDIDELRAALNESHFGMDKVKETIVEKIATQIYAGHSKGKVILLVGPPGTGKTTIVRQIAKALGRKFVRKALGGVSEESAIRGRDRSYKSADPGFIIKLLSAAGEKNPVWLLDEVDKIGDDHFHGAIGPALLEVLDPEQNDEFVDTFLEVPFDLSEILFIATANDISNVPGPLLDRCEVIRLPGYTNEEKLGIAELIIPKKLKEFNLTSRDLEITPEAIEMILVKYDFESGARKFFQLLDTIMRKVIVKRMEGENEKVIISPDNLATFLGKPKRRDDTLDLNPKVGEVKGLYVSGSSGGVSMIYAVTRPNHEEAIETSGYISEDTVESIISARTYLLGRLANNPAKIYEPLRQYTPKLLHVGFVQDGITKSGPSAGLASTMCILSELTNTPIRGDVAMTGAITPTGKVTMIGGTKNKILGAKRMGMTKVLIPADNMEDLDEGFIEKIGLEIIPVKTVEDAIPHVLIFDEI